MMEADHVSVLQLASVVFTLFGLSVRLPDKNSRLVVLDMAIEQGKSLVETLKLHVFREEHIVFPLAQKYLSHEELDHMMSSISPGAI